MTLDLFYHDEAVELCGGGDVCQQYGNLVVDQGGSHQNNSQGVNTSWKKTVVRPKCGCYVLYNYYIKLLYNYYYI